MIHIEGIGNKKITMEDQEGKNIELPFVRATISKRVTIDNSIECYLVCNDGKKPIETNLSLNSFVASEIEEIPFDDLDSQLDDRMAQYITEQGYSVNQL
jgi:hypothetical protein